MRLYFDLNLGYLVSTPGQADPLSGLAFKAGDEASVEVQFGRSNIFSKPDVPAWRSELLATSSNITIGLKLDTDFTDGTLLAGESDYTSGSSNCYVFALNLNTVEINTALGRDGGGTELPSVDCNFEVTYQDGGTGGWNSSTLPVPAIIYHDVLLGDETAPSNAADHNYPTKSDVIVWYPSRVGLTGGGSTKLDGIATTTLAANYAVALLDESATPDTLRFYRLQAGTTAESSPEIIRPDDYNASTNAKYWALYTTGGGGAVTLDTNTTTSGLTGLLKAVSDTLDVAVAGTDYLTPTGDGSGLTGIVTTPADGSITNAKLANMATSTIKGQIVGGSGAPVDLTASQARTILNVADGATAFNPAIPGAIGGTTPSTGAFTTISGTTATVTTVRASNALIGPSHLLNTQLWLGSGAICAWKSNADAELGSVDLALYRAAAASLQLGANHATTPTLQTIKAHNVTTGTGADLLLQGGTGSVAKGKVILDSSDISLNTKAAGSAENYTGVIYARGLLSLIGLSDSNYSYYSPNSGDVAKGEYAAGLYKPIYWDGSQWLDFLDAPFTFYIAP